MRHPFKLAPDIGHGIRAIFAGIDVSGSENYGITDIGRMIWSSIVIHLVMADHRIARFAHKLNRPMRQIDIGNPAIGLCRLHVIGSF